MAGLQEQPRGKKNIRRWAMERLSRNPWIMHGRRIGRTNVDSRGTAPGKKRSCEIVKQTMTATDTRVVIRANIPLIIHKFLPDSLKLINTRLTTGVKLSELPNL
jgi:hypothetical protein